MSQWRPMGSMAVRPTGSMLIRGKLLRSFCGPATNQREKKSHKCDLCAPASLSSFDCPSPAPAGFLPKMF